MSRCAGLCYGAVLSCRSCGPLCTITVLSSRISIFGICQIFLPTLRAIANFVGLARGMLDVPLYIVKEEIKKVKNVPAFARTNTTVPTGDTARPTSHGTIHI